MIHAEAIIQKRNLIGAVIVLLTAAIWIVFSDLSFSRDFTRALTGLSLGYLSFAIYDYRNVMHQITRPGHPENRRP